MVLAGQIISIFAMTANILAAQNKKKSGIIAFELCGTSLFAISFFLTESYVGAMLNLVGVFRSLIFLNEKKTRANHPLWLVFFISLYVTSFVLNFAVFEVEFIWSNVIFEVLPVCGMTLGTVGYRMKNATGTRRINIIRSPLWLIYNAFYANNIGATICESLSIISMITAMIRLDFKKAEAEGENAEELASADVELASADVENEAAPEVDAEAPSV